MMAVDLHPYEVTQQHASSLYVGVVDMSNASKWELDIGFMNDTSTMNHQTCNPVMWDERNSRFTEVDGTLPFDAALDDQKARNQHRIEIHPKSEYL
jgi:hypothetical protein